MRYTPTAYAQAFAALAKDARTAQEQKELVERFIACIKHNGDMAHRDAIIEKAADVLRTASGKRKVVLETARPIAGLQKKYASFLKSTDIVEEQISPELVAGIRITVDDENQFDGTLLRKLKTLFA